jgi:hypothetical protein
VSAQPGRVTLPMYSMIAVQVVDLNFVPLWPAGALVKAISSANVTLFMLRPCSQLALGSWHLAVGGL